MNFSQRLGLKPSELPLQINEMSDSLRYSLWNWICTVTGNELNNIWKDLLKIMNRLFFRLPIDDLPYHGHDCHKILRSRFMDLEWNEVYDFVEYYLQVILYRFEENEWRFQEQYKRQEESLNDILSDEFSGYRLIKGQFAPITDESELSAVREALNSTSSKYESIREHLDQAITL